MAILKTNENAGALTRPPATCPLCQYSCPKGEFATCEYQNLDIFDKGFVVNFLDLPT